MQHKAAGFTLIELLVVIAIIGILATVVIASVGTARSKAADAKVLAQLSSMQPEAETYFTANGDYGPVVSDCTTPSTLFTTPASSNGLADLLTTIPSNYLVSCSSYTASSGNATNWAVTAVGPTDAWCVDSTANRKDYHSTTFASPVNAVCQ